MPKVFQAVVLVDVEGATTEDEILALLPPERNFRVFKLSDHGAPRVERFGPNAQPIDWQRIGEAVEAAVRAVREASKDCTLQVYVAGQGPLPIFVHLGYAVSKFIGEQWVITGKPGSWVALALANQSDLPKLLVSQLRDGTSHATGQVGLYCDTGGRPVNAGAVSDAIESTGDRVADIVELRSKGALVIDKDNATGVAAEIVEFLSKAPALYPRSSGLSVFVAGPTFLAFAVGRAVNANIVPSTKVFDFGGGKYELACTLPFVEDVRPSIPTDDASVVDRNRVKDIALAAIAELKSEISEEDLASPLLPASRAQFLAQLRFLEYVETNANEFSLRVGNGTFSLGDGLLEALRQGHEDIQRRFTKLLLLHELFHEHQGIRSTNYFDIGRAGVVLEQIDLIADLFALRVMTRKTFRVEHVSTPKDVRALIIDWLDAVLYGIQAFDLLEHGARIKRLVDRRLRRYLTWHLQRARAETVDTPDDVATLLEPTLTAELAPVSSRIGLRYDREIIEALPGTEFFAALGGNLVRQNRRPGFDPADLVEAVRGYGAAVIQRAMTFLVEEYKQTLIPWRTRTR